MYYTTVKINVVKGCASGVLVHATFVQVYWTAGYKVNINTLRNLSQCCEFKLAAQQPVRLPQQMLSDVELVSDDDEDVHGRGSSKRSNPKFVMSHCIREPVPARV